jgi:hypothetical protein
LRPDCEQAIFSTTNLKPTARRSTFSLFFPPVFVFDHFAGLVLPAPHSGWSPFYKPDTDTGLNCVFGGHHALCSVLYMQMQYPVSQSQGRAARGFHQTNWAYGLISAVLALAPGTRRAYY